MLPGGPGDTSEFVGEGDGGLVVAAALRSGERPGAQPVERGTAFGGGEVALSTARAPWIRSVRR